MTKTARTIASRLAREYDVCAGNYEPIGAQMVNDCARALDLDFPGVWAHYRALVAASDYAALVRA
jgi:hypothetical protein